MSHPSQTGPMATHYHRQALNQARATELLTTPPRKSRGLAALLPTRNTWRDIAGALALVAVLVLVESLSWLLGLN